METTSEAIQIIKVVHDSGIYYQAWLRGEIIRDDIDSDELHAVRLHLEDAYDTTSEMC